MASCADVEACLADLCGERHGTNPWSALLQRLVRCVEGSQQHPTAHADTLEHAIAVCNTAIRRQCEERILLYPFADVPSDWLSLHADCALLSGCAALLIARTGHNKPRVFWLEAIRTLDTALIVSIRPGDARIHHTHRLIAALQTICAVPAMLPRHRKRRRCHVPELAVSPCAALPVLERAAMSDHEFERLGTERAQPFILRGYARHWRALQPTDTPRWADAAYLVGRAGPGRVVPVETGARYTDRDWGQTILPFDDFLEKIGWAEGGCSSHAPLYLAQHTLLVQFPWLSEDFQVPTYAYTSHRTRTEREPITSVWIGPAGTVSPPHTDPYCNCYVQVVGAKQVWVAPPDADQRGRMRTFDASASDGYAGLMHNTSRLDVFGEAPLVPSARDALLQPGDLLYLPPRWWHAMRSLTRSFSVSFWF